MELKKGYKRTEVGVIPQDWEVNNLEYYFSYISYGFTNPMPTTSSGIYMITANDIKGGEIVYNSARKTSLKAYKELITNKSRPIKNDILLTKDGSLGRLAIVNETNICINQSVATIRPNNKVFPLFLKKLLESNYYQNIMLSNAGGSTIKHIYITIVNKMKIGLPPNLPEQKAIARVLSDTDTLIQALQKKINKKRAIKQGAMQQLLRPKKGWERKKIEDVVSISTGSKNTQDKLKDGKYPFFVRSQTVERINSFTFDCEAVLTAGDGVGTGKIFHYLNGKFEVHQRVYVMSNFGDNLYGYYFYLYFKNNFYDRIMQMTAKSSVDSVRREMIADMEIPLPTYMEQKRIATILSDMDTEIVQLEEKLAKYKNIKQGLMQNLLTGKIRLV